jgi:hypothetical protein
MEYVYKTVDSERLTGIFDLPYSLLGKRVEVIIMPVHGNSEEQSSRKSAFGCLREYANPEIMNLENGAWERAVVEQYGDC